MLDSARFLVMELVKRPVKEAVREALEEEGVAAESAGGERATQSRPTSGRRSASESQQSSGGGRSPFVWMLGLAAVAGIAYLARQRMSSTTGSAWSEQSPGAVAEDDAEGGYVSEGEMQTAESAGEDSSGEGSSASTATEQ